MGFFYAEFAPRGVHAAAAEQVGGGCGRPRHPLGWAYPVLFCVEVECGHKPSAVRRVSEANLKVERFGEKAERLFRKISRPKHRSSSKSWFGAETGEGACGPLPLAPNPKGATLQALRASSPQGEPLNLFDSQPEGGGRGGRRLGKGKALPLAPIPVGGTTPQSACGLTAPLTQGSRGTKQTTLPCAQRGQSSPCTGEPKGEADSTSLCVKRQEPPPCTEEPKGKADSTFLCAKRQEPPPLHRGAEGRSRQHFLVRKEARASPLHRGAEG